MKRYERLLCRLRWCLGSALAVLIGHLKSVTMESSHGGAQISNWLFLLFALIVFAVFELLFDFVLENSTTVRRLLAGKDFIEGYWLDVARDSKSGELLNVAMIFIEYKEGRIQAHGHAFLLNGHPDGSFDTKFAEYEGRELMYGYEIRASQRSAHGKRPIIGAGVYTFESGHGPAKTFTGEFFDSHSASLFVVTGEKIVDQAREKACRDSQARVNVVREFVARTELLIHILPADGGLPSDSGTSHPNAQDQTCGRSPTSIDESSSLSATANSVSVDNPEAPNQLR